MHCSSRRKPCKVVRKEKKNEIKEGRKVKRQKVAQLPKRVKLEKEVDAKTTERKENGYKDL